jgi:predicted DNA-binding transcriptional regulator AlpA
MSDDRKPSSIVRTLWDQLAATGGIVTVSEIADRLDVSRAYASKITRRDDFPPPVDTLGERPVWLWADVEGWREAERKPGPKPRSG